jgi:hypothetical protein
MLTQLVSLCGPSLILPFWGMVSSGWRHLRGRVDVSIEMQAVEGLVEDASAFSAAEVVGLGQRIGFDARCAWIGTSRAGLETSSRR